MYVYYPFEETQTKLFGHPARGEQYLLYMNHDDDRLPYMTTADYR